MTSGVVVRTPAGARTVVAGRPLVSNRVTNPSSVPGTPDPPEPPPLPSAPVISGVGESNLTTTGVTITFTVDQIATGHIKYGTVQGGPWGSTTPAVQQIATHVHSLTGLSSSTTYWYKPVAVNSAAQSTDGSEGSFTTATPPSSATIEGYGYAATGGNAYAATPTVVTNLNDTGAGSYRNAVASGSRYITFGPGVNGTITLATALYLPSNITVDGASCDGAGITFKGRYQRIDAVTNIILRSLRFKDQDDGTAAEYVDDAITIINGATNIVVDHCSFDNQEDGCLDISLNCTDITVQWNIFGPTRRGQSQGYLLNDQFKNSYRVTWHHNIWIDDIGQVDANWMSRTPGLGDTSSYDTVVGGRLTADIRCNTVWGLTNGYVGVTVQCNTRANVVKHYFFGRSGQTGVNYVVQTQLGGQAYSSGNYNRRGGVTTTSSPMSEIVPPAAAQVTEEATAQLAAAAVLAGAGCRVGGLDSTDSTKLGAIQTYLDANGGW